MPDAQAFLTKKAGPLPVWGWAALGGGLVTVLYLRGKGQTPAPVPDGQGTDGSQQGLFAPSPIVVTPGTMTQQTSSMNPTPPTPPTTPTVTVASPDGHPVTIWSYDRSHQGSLGSVPSGTVLPIISPAIGFAGDSGFLVRWAGGVGFVGGANVTSSTAGGAPGMGGGPAALRTLPGAGHVGRFTSPHAHPQFLNVGMGGGGHHGLRRVSQRTGLPMARLMALNPGHWRPQPGGQPRHIQIR